MKADQKILDLIIEVRDTVKTLHQKVDLFDKKLNYHMQEDAAWQAKLLKKIPSRANAITKPKSKVVKPND